MFSIWKSSKLLNGKGLTLSYMKNFGLLALKESADVNFKNFKFDETGGKFFEKVRKHSRTRRNSSL